MKHIECWPSDTVDILVGLCQEDEFKLKPMDNGKVMITCLKRREGHEGDLCKLQGGSLKGWEPVLQDNTSGPQAEHGVSGELPDRR